ncbi:TetR/AcrR family transcriptional regulator [Kribbella albertanoniae]|uniref:TetR/AcrR family transcriptional regulator n=1 Tax=Kribbella albertanoniae TaxID=1266829 RepID=A0A4R4Q131_9ACTN|nr:TetR/AcrR family transcriptional regulator [Kribbella albertanoniae]TDC28482.1 TetR/AcrR family transcriptional regulator [Kribbella albertanoniae]
MVRPRMFDEDQAVDAAMRVFWASGYEATSTQELCTATGLGRSSIYNTFSSKRALFDLALRRYMEQTTSAQLELIRRTDLPIRERVRQILWRAVEPDPGDPSGCLVINTVVELGPTDPELVEILDRDHAVKLKALALEIRAAQTAGEVDASRDPEALADYVYVVLGGLRVAARRGAATRVQESVIEAALHAF